MSDEIDEGFERAAKLFAVLSTPIRLRIIIALCQGEKNVEQWLDQMGVAQPNMSQHLSILYRSGILGKRRQGARWMPGLQMKPPWCFAVPCARKSPSTVARIDNAK